MPLYVLHNTHGPQECGSLMEAIQQQPWSSRLKGRDFYCTCPGGVHQGFVAVEADTAEDALSLVDPAFRAGARAIEAISGVVGEHERLPVSS
jgi:hypothetical protein